MSVIFQEFQVTSRSVDLYYRAAELLDRLEAEFCRVSGELRQKVAAD